MQWESGGRKPNPPMCVGRCVLKPTPNPRQLPLAWLSGQSNFWAAKSRNAIVSQEIMILQHLHHTRSACHCLNCGTDLIPSCICRGNLKQAGSQGGVPVGCGTGYKNICFFFWCMQWQEPALYLYTTWKQNDLHWWHGHKNGHMDCFEGSESCFVSANWSS